jgi:SAM-dependent methyltransferase
MEIGALLDHASELEDAGRLGDALTEAWRALDLASDNPRAKRLVARLLRFNPALASEDRMTSLQRLLSDPDFDPDAITSAGWMLLLKQRKLSPSGDAKAMAATLEQEPLALRLLAEGCVCILDAELALTEARRWLLLAGRWPDYPRLTQALIAQAAHNGGAWPFDADESAALERPDSSAFAASYYSERLPPPTGKVFGEVVTQAIADQYVGWPYPVWSRLLAPKPTTVPRMVEKLDGGRPSDLPVEADVLVAGCGTGHEAALLAKRFPDARITAIDISASSLAYAAERCRGLDIEFRLLDLHEVARLQRRFELISCNGVLHHLPDPEAGWAKLVEVLKPGGVMNVMLYSRLGRLPIQAAQFHIADLGNRPINDELLRAVRQRLIEKAPRFVAGSPDFFSLGGVHDLLLNRHEDPFDVPRIARAMVRLGLELLRFRLPTAAAEGRYRRQHPDDRLFRDVDAWASLERAEPLLFSEMYDFWCRRAL